MIDIILPFFNQADLVCRCLRSVALSASSECRVIVVDDASEAEQSARVREACKSLTVDHVFIGRGANGGFGASVGTALEVASGRHLVLLNSDTIVTPGFAERLVKVMSADATIKAVAPVSNNSRDLFQYRADLIIDTTISSSILRSVSKVAADRAEQFYNQCTFAPYLTAACLALDREAFDQVGGLDQGYEHGYFEDLDLCCILRRARHHLAVREDCFVYHEGQATYGALGGDALSAIIGRNLDRFRARWGHLPEHDDLMTLIAQTPKAVQ